MFEERGENTGRAVIDDQSLGQEAETRGILAKSIWGKYSLISERISYNQGPAT
jgi:hypothetical protein